MRLHYKILGKAWGNFRPSDSSREQVLALIRRATLEVSPNLRSIFVPRAAFSNRVAQGNNPGERKMWDDFVGRSSILADGGLVSEAQRAVGFFSGDCPILCLWQDDQLAVLHAGYRCLVRELGSEPNIIDVAMRHFDPLRVQAWVGLGIGPCCWIPGYTTKPEILDPARHQMCDVIRACLSRTLFTSPGGAGHVSVDLITLAELLLQRADVSAARITVDRRCTCCWQEDNRFVCWSLTRAKAGRDDDGRNLAFAWLGPHAS